MLSYQDLLLCAPTGAGKTIVSIFAILQLIGMNRREDGSINNSDYKIVYLVPVKALVADMVDFLYEHLKYYCVQVKEISGDGTLIWQHIEQTQIIVTTPKEWDGVTRKCGTRAYMWRVKLHIYDEIDLLHHNRGPALEGIVARAVRQSEMTKEHIRFVGLSATLPDSKDVAYFLRVDVEKGLFYFDDSCRQVLLDQRYVGITGEEPSHRLEKMNDVCYKRVISVKEEQRVIIFCHSRNDTVETARALRETALARTTLSKLSKKDYTSRKTMKRFTESVNDKDLKDLLSCGFAVHYEGLGRDDREIVEEVFGKGIVRVLLSTSTPGWGVNLSADVVIIKSTQVYNREQSAWTELSYFDVIQMLHRAGRPQFDTNAEVIIITEQNNLHRYRSLMDRQLPVESQFTISKLADSLNAEIVLGTVQNIQEARNWLTYTYLYVRMKHNCTLKDQTLEEWGADLVHSAAKLLDSNLLVQYDQNRGSFEFTELGYIASFYYITNGSIATYNGRLVDTMGDIELCRLVSLSEEFKYVTVRQNEKMELEKLRERVHIPVKEIREEKSEKINVLLQSYISKSKPKGLSLTSDMIFIGQSAGRLMRALFAIVLEKGWAQLAEKALKWCKMITRRMWDVQTPLRQFDIIPRSILRKLEKENITWDKYYDLSAQDISDIIKFSMEGTVFKLIRQVPKLILAVHVQRKTRSGLEVGLVITPDFLWEDKVHGFVEPFWVIVKDDEGMILHHERFLLKKQYINKDHNLTFTVTMSAQYFICVVSDKWIGSQSVSQVLFRHPTPPEQYPPTTKLQNWPPLSVTELRIPWYEDLYQDFKHFNRVQTQVFPILYNTDDNVLVAAPTGSGKTICAEFAILRNYQCRKISFMRVVYIAPMQALANERFTDWNRKFNNRMRVVQLTGDTDEDFNLFLAGEIIISTPEKWDALSCRWDLCKYLLKISLFIIDELHLIGGQVGSVMEVIVSKIRCIASQGKHKIRILALSTTVANANDLGGWIGATSNGIFSFPPDVRPVPLKIEVHGINTLKFEDRIQAMTRPAYTKIAQHARRGKPAIVFVPTGLHARITAVELMTLARFNSDDNAIFLLCSVEELAPHLNNIKDDKLRMTLRYGIGYLDEDLTSTDQDTITTLFTTGWIQVCVMNGAMCWGGPLTAHLVVVMEPTCCDRRRDFQTDLPVTTILQMMGHASRPLVDQSGECVIFCHAQLEKYYKKYLYEAFPVESHLHHYMHNFLKARVVDGVDNEQAAMDYMEKTFIYRRLTKNPNHYGLQAASDKHRSNYLSKLVKRTLADLESTNLVRIEAEFIVPSHMGMISCKYYISCATMKQFNTFLTQTTDRNGLLKILASASEYDLLPARLGEEEKLRKLINDARFPFQKPNHLDPHVKANVLLQAHLSRHMLNGNLASDQQEVLLSANRLLQAMVDIISSKGWLHLALTVLEMTQMVAQGMWEHDSELIQIPHFTEQLAKRCQQRGVERISHLLELEHDERCQLLTLSDEQLHDVELFCNHIPAEMDLSCTVLDEDNIMAGENMRLEVKVLLRFNQRQHLKHSDWWIIVGSIKSDQVFFIRKIRLSRVRTFKVNFIAPAESGWKEYTLYAMSDRYRGSNYLLHFAFYVQ